MKLKGKSVLITGATAGLGSIVTARFLAQGAHVTAVSRSIAAANHTEVNLRVVSSDLSSHEESQRVMRDVQSNQGRIDALVHLVGSFGAGPLLHDTEDSLLNRMLAINFLSAFHIIRAVLPAIRHAGSGRILAIGSRAALTPSAGQAAYAASKAALTSLVRSVAIEYPEVSANVVVPGTLDTAANRQAAPGADMTRWTSPSQVAALLVHLVSDDAAHLTGAVIPIGREAL